MNLHLSEEDTAKHNRWLFIDVDVGTIIVPPWTKPDAAQLLLDALSGKSSNN